jgi:uncharacterized damage-inducible protein DinB
MTDSHKDRLHVYLTQAREAVLWKVEGLSEHDLRRPLTGTGLNLLGLVKHLSICESRYFGESFGRPFERHLPWWDDDQVADADMWATASESSTEILATYRAVTAHADETITALDLETPGQVSWWPRPDVTLYAVLVHMVTETVRHAGHADILREQVDGRTGMGPRDSDPRQFGDGHWSQYRSQVEAAALEAAQSQETALTAAQRRGPTAR